MNTEYKSIRVSEEVHRKARLLAALLGVEIREAVELAVDKALTEAQAKKAKEKSK